MKSFLSSIILLLSINSFSQRGKDGTVNITAANSVVNLYTPMTSNVSAGATTINVANTTGYAIGDLVMIIQMQGAGVRASWDNISGDYTNSIPENTSHGEIYTYNNAGNYEFAEITAVPDGITIVLDCGLRKNYDVSFVTTANPFPHGVTLPGRVQVVKVPRYYALTVSGAGSMVCQPWDGSTGGILAVEIETNTLLNATPSIDVSNRGFRGGAIESYNGSVSGGQKWGSSVAAQGAYKGESIAGDTGVYRFFSSVFGRGAMANGGGGGTSHNSGGGGGANGGAVAAYNGYGNPVAGYTAAWNIETAGFATNTSSGGGRGGYSFSSASQNVNTRAPGSTQWSGDNRRVVGGMGGRPLDYSTGRLFIGGGGGAGDGNDGRAGAGGNGGGMAFIVCYGNLTGSGTILANGANGSSSTPGCSANDAAGGGGGGGTIVLNINGTTNLTATTPLSARGGNGGNVVFNCALTNTDGYGPGAGGGGGYIATSGAVPANTMTGGNNGIQTGNTSSIATNFPPNGATMGGAGSNGSIANYTLNVSGSQTVCANQAFTVSAASTEPGTSVSWYNVAAGGTAVASGSTYNAPGFPSTGTYTIYAGVCPGTYRQPIIITVNSGLAISVNSPTICPGQSVVLTPTSTATSYTWSTGATSTTISVSPASTTAYTVTGSSGSCTGSQIAIVNVGSGIGVTVNSPTICAGTNTILTAGGATTYSWSTGATTSTISVNPSSTTIYTVTGTAGTCTGSATSNVTVNTPPVLNITASPAAICAGNSSTLTVSGANTYTWSNSFNGSTQAVSPGSTSNYSVTGTSAAGCTNTLNASVTITVSPNPTITVNSSTICVGQTATLTANGGTSYNWSNSQTGSSISVSPASTTVYTVTGTVASCSTTQTTAVNVSPAMIIAVNSPTICSGQSALLTATSSATSYTWSTGANTNSISVAPTSTTIYTVAGSAGSCAGANTATVTVNPSPLLSAAASPSDICTGQSTTLTVTGAATYTWSNGPNTSTQTVSPASGTTYSVSGTLGSCVSTTPFVLTVNVTSSPTISVNSATICPVSFATLTANGATSYSWNTGAATPYIHPSPSTTTEYTVTGFNGNCSSVAVATVVVLPAPSIVSSVSEISGCTPLCVNFMETTGSVNYSVQYSFGDGITATTKNPTHCYNTAGSFTASVMITDPSFGCTNTYILPSPINVFAKPTAAFSIANGTIVIAGSTVNFVNNSNNATTYLWNVCGSTGYTSKDLSITASDTGQCCIGLMARSGSGCVDTIIQCIKVINEATVSVPNVFTPNNDAKNDLFKITGNGIKNLNCTIYDRWGIKMYEWDGINGYWDGKTKTGAAAVDGSYFYIINYTDFKDVSKTEKGFLSLFRN